MSCQDTASIGADYQYSHDETATIRLYPSSSSNTDTPSLNSRVLLESTSTLTSSSPLFHRNVNGDNGKPIATTGTPFSRQVLEMISHYPMQRLLIRIGDAAASSSNGNLDATLIEGGSIDYQQVLQQERERGPSGTSIFASFVQQHPEAGESKEYYQDQYASLVRYLLDNTLFPPCGAPLDSVRVRKHGHSTIVHNEEKNTASEKRTVNVESFLAADAATFCNPGISSFLLAKGKAQKNGGWGAATSNGGCHSSDNWGLFDSLFEDSSSVVTSLSHLLLGTSDDATPWEHGSVGEGNKRNSVWVDLQVSPSCFYTDNALNTGEECSVKVTRGASYRIALPTPSLTSGPRHLSLGDLLIGRNTLQQQSLTSGEEGMAYYPCPLSDSGRIVMYLPPGYGVSLAGGIEKISDRSDKKMVFNVLDMENGYITLAAPLFQFQPVNERESNSQLSSQFGISRTVQRPLGIASSGTLVTVLRYDGLKSEQSQIVEVASLDVLPGTLTKPRMNTLRMTLYRGGGAGGGRFVPPLFSDEQVCECIDNDTGNTESHERSDRCGPICQKNIILSEMQDHKITLHPDGTIFLERTVQLQPDSSLWMSVDFDEAYLPFQKFPADANRGVDIFPPRATFTPISVSSQTASLQSTTLYSPSLLILPPVPDMSMPFNVISLSCTLWAFVLGSLLNILVRRGTESVKWELTGEKEKRPLDKLKEKLQEKGRRVKDKLKRLKDKVKGKKVPEQKEGDLVVEEKKTIQVC